MLKNIIAKTSVHPKEIEHKLNLGFNQFEIQLLSEEDYKCDKIFDMFSEMHIKGIYTPLLNFYEDVLLENISDGGKYYNLFINTCEFAQKAAEYYQENVYIIIHNGLSYSQYKTINPLTNKIVEILNQVKIKYPDIYILVENVVPFLYDNTFVNGFNICDLYKTISYFNKLLKLPYLGICFDTCHYMISNLQMDWIINNSQYRNNKKYVNPKITYKDIFSKYGNFIKVVHLNNMIKDGMLPETHGTAFTNNKKDLFILTEILDAYVKTNSSAYLTLEVREDDYLNVKNLPETYNNVKKVFTYLHTNILESF